jgi:hypothetical protein
VKTWPRSGNVIENKGSYASKAGMLLKRKAVSRWQVGKNRFQVSGIGCQGSGVRNENEDRLPSAFCLLLSADCPLYAAELINEPCGLGVAMQFASDAVFPTHNPSRLAIYRCHKRPERHKGVTSLLELGDEPR